MAEQRKHNRREKVAHDDRIGKVFVALDHGMRKCLVCDQVFTRQAASKHADVVCFRRKRKLSWHTEQTGGRQHMDLIDNKGEKIGSLTTAIPNDEVVTINRTYDVTIVTTRDRNTGKVTTENVRGCHASGIPTGISFIHWGAGDKRRKLVLTDCNN
jgi:hypothetical protein